MARMRMTQAINQALHEEMARDERVILFGEDVRISIFADTRGLAEEFGSDRVLDTPLSEALLAGMTVGAAATGLRPIFHLMFGNFFYTAWDAIANQAAKFRYMTGGQVTMPLVFMAVFGGGRSQGAQHSDTMHSMLVNLGGLKVVTPATPADAKGLMKAAIRDDNPVVFLQSAGRGGDLGEVPDGDWIVPLGQADVKRQGEDVTVIAIGAMVRLAMRAADVLAKDGVGVEVIDPRTLRPLDTDTILRSVRKTGRVVVVDEGRLSCGMASEIAAIVAEHEFESLKAPVRRVAAADVPIPFSPPLEREVLPSEDRVVSAIRSTLTKR
ncbi:MAG TPA: alpha-ketoacid dehydrogenase subunit beta [Candidatus Dormibacteraeota bacterium]|jgi:pyruvate dehydrogenase E1 component beta subunit